jgi:hypothetical protein
MGGSLEESDEDVASTLNAASCRVPRGKGETAHVGRFSAAVCFGYNPDASGARPDFKTP